jgi:hypothetical protein
MKFFGAIILTVAAFLALLVFAVKFGVAGKDDIAPVRISGDHRDRSGQFAHVPALLHAIPDPIEVVNGPETHDLPLSPGIQLREFKRGSLLSWVVEVLRDGQSVGLFSPEMQLIPIDSRRIALFHTRMNGDAILASVWLDRLKPIAAPESRAGAIREGEIAFEFERGAYEWMKIPRLAPGEHPMQFPPMIAELGELVLFYPTTVPLVKTYAWMMRIDPAHDRVIAIAPRVELLTDLDGYHFPARVFRDPKTGRIVGDGWRLRPFVLSDDLTTIEYWLE